MCREGLMEMSSGLLALATMLCSLLGPSATVSHEQNGNIGAKSSVSPRRRSLAEVNSSVFRSVFENCTSQFLLFLSLCTQHQTVEE